FVVNTSSVRGGAVSAAANSPALTTTMTVTDCTFLGNSTFFGGGAISTNYQLSVSSMTTASYFDNNRTSTGGGGAILWSGSQDSNITITSITFYNNRAQFGGGVALSANASAGTATETITRCLFHLNTAS